MITITALVDVGIKRHYDATDSGAEALDLLLRQITRSSGPGPNQLMFRFSRPKSNIRDQNEGFYVSLGSSSETPDPTPYFGDAEMMSQSVGANRDWTTGTIGEIVESAIGWLQMLTGEEIPQFKIVTTNWYRCPVIFIGLAQDDLA